MFGAGQQPPRQPSDGQNIYCRRVINNVARSPGFGCVSWRYRAGNVERFIRVLFVGWRRTWLHIDSQCAAWVKGDWHRSHAALRHPHHLFQSNTRRQRSPAGFDWIVTYVAVTSPTTNSPPWLLVSMPGISRLLLRVTAFKKPGFHYPNWRPELTVTGFHYPPTRWRARVSTSRVDGPCWRPVNTARVEMEWNGNRSPSTRAVNSGRQLG